MLWQLGHASFFLEHFPINAKAGQILPQSIRVIGIFFLFHMQIADAALSGRPSEFRPTLHALASSPLINTRLSAGWLTPLNPTPQPFQRFPCVERMRHICYERSVVGSNTDVW
jgi:hypothetical protein